MRLISYLERINLRHLLIFVQKVLYSWSLLATQCSTLCSAWSLVIKSHTAVSMITGAKIVTASYSYLDNILMIQKLPAKCPSLTSF